MESLNMKHFDCKTCELHMIDNCEITIVEYGFEYESLQLTNVHCPRLDVNGIFPFKDIRCVINDASRLV